MIRSGDLRHRVEVYRRDDAVDELGSPKAAFTRIDELWAAIEPLQGRELFLARQTMARVSVKFTFRYYPGALHPKWQIRARGRVFNPISVINIDERDEKTEVYCEEPVS